MSEIAPFILTHSPRQHHEDSSIYIIVAYILQKQILNNVLNNSEEH